ncbi:Hypothetical predicted protein, partial [Pelobates cultripes]
MTGSWHIILPKGILHDLMPFFLMLAMKLPRHKAMAYCLTSRLILGDFPGGSLLEVNYWEHRTLSSHIGYNALKMEHKSQKLPPGADSETRDMLQRQPQHKVAEHPEACALTPLPAPPQ